jgi:hypothetical protein
LADLKPGKPATPPAADLLDATLGANSPIAKSGYNITYAQTAMDANGCGTTYTIVALPQNVGTTGQRAFCTDQTGVIHFNTTGAGCNPAPGADPVLQ